LSPGIAPGLLFILNRYNKYMRTPHTSTFKGKTVFVILKDGTQIIDKFVDKKSGVVFLEKTGKVPVSLIRSFSHRKLKEE
jgi:hypothetical protein